MTPRGGPLSEKGRAYVLCLIIPILWPLAFAMLMEDLCHWTADRVRALYWRWRHWTDQ